MEVVLVYVFVSSISFVMDQDQWFGNSFDYFGCVTGSWPSFAS